MIITSSQCFCIYHCMRDLRYQCKSKDRLCYYSAIPLISYGRLKVSHFDDKDLNFLRVCSTHQELYLSTQESKICYQAILPLLCSWYWDVYSISILNSENKLTSLFFSVKIIKESSSDATKVHKSSRRRRIPNPNSGHHKHTTKPSRSSIP